MRRLFDRSSLLSCGGATSLVRRGGSPASRRRSVIRPDHAKNDPPPRPERVSAWQIGGTIEYKFGTLWHS